jgi:hypothetical protein
LLPITFQESSGEKIFASERQLQNCQAISIHGAVLDDSLSYFFGQGSPNHDG